MTKRIIGLILVAIALFNVYLGMKAEGNAPVNKEIIENAVFVTDGRLIPENEGKVVIVQGVLEAPLPYVDEETGIALYSIVNHRQVEKLATEYDSEEKKSHWKWEFTGLLDHYGGSNKIIVPGVTMGEYSVARELLLSITAREYRTTYDKKELNRQEWNTFEDNGRVYLYKGVQMPEDDEIAVKADRDLEGTLRVAYAEIPEGASPEYTIIGVQKEGALLEVEAMDMVAAHPGHLTVEELLAYADTSAASAKKTALIIAAVLAVIGILMITAKEEKRGGKK